MTTSLGLSAGSGMIHCVLLTTDESGRTHAVNRVIDVDPTDGLTRAGRVNSGIDLMLGQAKDTNGRVGTIGVTYRTDEQAREIASRGTGAKRQIHLIAETEAVAHQLISSGEISRFESVVVADLGDTGMSLYAVDPKTRRISDYRRSAVLSGDAVDALLADEISRTDRLRGRRKSSVISACRTAKEELSVRDSTALMTGNPALPITITRSTLERLVRPMASAAADEATEYVSDTRAEAVVLIGGLANVPMIRDLIVERTGLESVLPQAPESVAATGAAALAASSKSGSALAFIGGRRSRDWLSAAPLAVFGALLAGALMTVYAVGSSLAGNPSTPSTAPSSSISSEADQQTTSTTTDTTHQHPGTTATATSTPQQTSITYVPPPVTETVDSTSGGVGGGTGGGVGGGNGEPGWATTELPAPTSPSDAPSTSTLNPTLWPFPIPSLTWPPSLGEPQSTTPNSTGMVPPATPITPPEAAPQETTPPETAPPTPDSQAPEQRQGDAPTASEPQSDSIPITPPVG